MRSNTAEHRILRAIKAHCDRRPDVKLWRNATGRVRAPSGQIFAYGLGKGSSDLIGYQTITITEDMVGKRAAIFLAIEVKRPMGRDRDGQVAFLHDVLLDGGKAGTAESLAEAKGLLDA